MVECIPADAHVESRIVHRVTEQRDDDDEGSLAALNNEQTTSQQATRRAGHLTQESFTSAVFRCVFDALACAKNYLEMLRCEMLRCRAFFSKWNKWVIIIRTRIARSREEKEKETACIACIA